MRKNNFGRQWEHEVSEYLKNKGFEILENNYTIKGGEADIIARDGEYICFVEVKYRSIKAVDAYSSVGFKKQKRVIKAAEKYMAEKRCSLQPRFDVVFVFDDEGEPDLEYIKNAYSG